ncbi:hypothetical protein GF373_16455 [bacterium]|nr:hypothetical protein [bacterium]
MSHYSFRLLSLLFLGFIFSSCQTSSLTLSRDIPLTAEMYSKLRNQQIRANAQKEKKIRYTTKSVPRNETEKAKTASKPEQKPQSQNKGEKVAKNQAERKKEKSPKPSKEKDTPQSKKPTQSTQKKPEKDKKETSPAMEGKTDKRKKEEPVEKKLVKPPRVEVLEERTGEYPLLHVTLRVFGPDSQPVASLSKKDIQVEFPAGTYQNSTWGAGAFASLSDYCPMAPLSQSGIVSIIRKKGAEKPAYEIEMFDGYWNPKDSNREYKLTILADGHEIDHTIAFSAKKERLTALFQKEWQGAMNAIQESSTVDPYVNALLNRYSAVSLDPFFQKLLNHVKNKLWKTDLLATKAVLRNLHKLHAEDKKWQSAIQKGYKTIGLQLQKQENFSKAIPFFQASLSLGEDGEVLEPLMDCYMRTFDFAKARTLLTRLDTNAMPVEKQKKYNRLNAQIHGSLLEFKQAESILYKQYKSSSGLDPFWSYWPLLWKGPWYAGTTKMVASFSQEMEDNDSFKNLTQDINKLADVKWMGWVNGEGEIEYCTHAEFLARNIKKLYPHLSRFSFKNASRPLLIDNKTESSWQGFLVVPAEIQEASGCMVLHYSSALVTRKEHELWYALEKRIEESSPRDRLRERMINRCGAAMMKTLGRGLERLRLDESNFTEQVFPMHALLSPSLIHYGVLVGRTQPDAPIAILKSFPEGLPDSILFDPKANRNPFYQYKKQMWNGRTLFEMNIGIYSQEDWLGAYRLGCSWDDVD